ncbi:MAG: DUF2157 domain-containing protein, partial [Proteobacteria bacterium]|nr:DUF2157 domain-containing protein [Pseudomonadota bacterium]
MHTLEAECRELHALGGIDDATAERAIALESGRVFSLYGEIRLALYAAVAAITTGVGLLLKDNLERIGPLTLVLAVALVAAGCYAWAIRAHRRGEARSLGGDYVLLLGALLLSADVGYAESQFHWLGEHWSWHLLGLALVHALTAYALDSRLVLSVALTSLAGWFGVEAQPALLAGAAGVRGAAAPALECAAAILAWRVAHRRLGGGDAFAAVFEHFAANVAFWGALALVFDAGTRLAGTALLLALAALVVARGLARREEAFAIYAVGYAA